MRFTSDWFSHAIPHWRRDIVPRLAGTACSAMEIGSHEGRSALWMLENVLTHRRSRLWCLDVWSDPRVEARFDANLVESGCRDRVEKVKAPSALTLRRLRSKHRFALIYIDGSHEARDCLTDAVLAFPLLIPGGFLVFDDYRWQPRGRVRHPPQVAIDAFLTMWSDQVDVVHHEHQVILAKTAE